MTTALIRLDHADIAVAREWADNVVRSGIEDHPNPTGFATPDRYLLGYLGELAFGSWLVAQRILHQHRVQTQGKSDAPEFIVWRDRHPQRVDVKTAGDARHKRLLVSVAQELDADLYVAARVVSLPERLVELHGWLERDQVLSLPVEDFGYGDSRWALLDRLRPMEDLMRCLEGQRTVRSGVPTP